jgi:parallel beta-helix repeat protein
MSRSIAALTLVVAGTLFVACSSGPTFPAGTSEAVIQSAFSTAKDGATLSFAAGTFTFTNTLTVAAKNVTVKGAGASDGGTLLNFSGQTAGSDGIDGLAGSDGLLFTGFAIRDTKGNGIRVEKSTGVTFDDINVSWTSVDMHTHGPYGVYPVTSKNVTVKNSTVSGASDTGIYVGQSDGIIIKNNTAFQNVAGIEIENSYNADVHDNDSHDNTAGILVFDLPGLAQQGGHNVRVFNNTMTHNNTPNFAAAGDIVSIVPAGTGFFVMANHDVEVFGNTIQQNDTVGLAVISYLITGVPFNPDGGYYPYPFQVYAHDNTVPCDGASQSNGTAPDTLNQFGALFLTVQGLFPNSTIPALNYDGILDPGWVLDAGFGNKDPMQICFKNNALGNIQTDGGFTGFLDLHYDQFMLDAGPVGNLAQIMTQNLPDFTCTGTVLPAVSF